jgi:diguanylate cyclase (GGDEF)-like protein
MSRLGDGIRRIIRFDAALRLTTLIFVTLPTLHAQQFTFTSYGEGSGLSNLNGTALLQDQSGIVWAGTQNGLFTADGNRFEKNVEVAASGFEDIRAVREDRAGRIWVADGRRVGYWQDGKVQVLHDVAMDVMSHEAIELISLTGQHDGVYLLRAGELLLISTADHGRTWRATPALTPELLRTLPDLKMITTATGAENGKLWAGCGNALCLIDIHQQKAIRYGQAAGVPKDEWAALQVTRAGEIWARGAKNVIVSNGGTVKFERVRNLPADSFGSIRHMLILQDSAGRLILNLTRGLAIGGRAGWQILRKANGLPEDEIDTVMQDRAGALWLTSLGHGILRWRGFGEWEGWNKDAGLQSNIVWGITRDARNNLWVATNTGLDKLSVTTGVITAQGFSGKRLFSVLADPREHLWINDGTGRIVDFDPKTRTSRIAATGMERVFQLYIDRSHRIWACSRKGLFYFSPTDKWKALHAVREPGSPKGYAWSIAEAPDGTLWVDADKKLFRMVGEHWSEVHLPFDEGHRQNRMVAAVADGTLWVQSSLPYPVVHLAVDGDIAKVISDVDSTQIASDNTTFLETDRRGWIWVGSDDGVHVYNGKEWTLYTEEDGLLWDDTDFHAFAEDPDGSVWIGTSAGVSHMIHPEHMFEHPSPQGPLVDVELDGKKLPERNAVFDVRRPTLSFHFRNPNYDRGSAVVAQYRLDGEETEWQDASGTLVRFPALQAGVYDLRVRASDRRLGRTSSERQIHFVILEPWWKRRWFLIVEALAAVLLLLGIWRLSVSLLVARQRQLARLVGLRTTELEKEKKELLSARSALLEIARRDALTGLLNRSAILDQLETLCQLRSPRTLPLAIIMADLDCFKKINDTHGHLAGDAVLRECATRMRNVTRECDLVGRYGGEELLIVMVGVPLELATARIEAIRMAIGATPILYDSVELFVTCSFGVAWLYEGEGRVEDLLSLADAALYRAKRNGRNRVEYGLPPDFDSAAPLYVEAQTIQ